MNYYDKLSDADILEIYEILEADNEAMLIEQEKEEEEEAVRLFKFYDEIEKAEADQK